MKCVRQWIIYLNICLFCVFRLVFIMSNNQNPKRFKTLHSFFRKNTESSNETSADTFGHSQPEIERVESQSQRFENNQEFDMNSLERDPGVRRQICSYPVNEHDKIRLSYIMLGPCQPKLAEYPSHLDGDQNRRFIESWFTKFSWLEYSVKEDKAYCFPCFLFDSNQSHKTFTIVGFRNWKRVGGENCRLHHHVGNANSAHHLAMQQWQNLRNPSAHIDKVVDRLPPKKVMQNRLRLNATIESVRFLGNQALTFRDNDESISSNNRENFHELVEAFGRISEEVKKVLENAPFNAKYTSPTIQKEVLNIMANKIRNKIREEVGDKKFCILVDEARDSSNKEQMAIILRFVDCKGLVTERFFDIVNVPDTTSQTLKDEICKVLGKYNLLVENMRGQGYDGASNMRGAWNGL